MERRKVWEFGLDRDFSLLLLSTSAFFILKLSWNPKVQNVAYQGSPRLFLLTSLPLRGQFLDYILKCRCYRDAILYAIPMSQYLFQIKISTDQRAIAWRAQWQEEIKTVRYFYWLFRQGCSLTLPSSRRRVYLLTNIRIFIFPLFCCSTCVLDRAANMHVDLTLHCYVQNLPWLMMLKNTGNTDLSRTVRPRYVQNVPAKTIL